MESELQTSAPNKAGFSLTKLVLLIGAFLIGLRLLRAQGAVDFRGRTVLISGGSRGLGLNIARQFARERANLVLVARDEDELKAAQKQLEDLGAKVLTVVADVTKKADCERAVEAAVKQFGSLDGLVNNAGVIQVGPLEHMNDDDFKAAVDLHIWAPLYLSRAALPYLKRGKVGRIANIASFGGVVAVPHMTPYVASKFGLVGLSDAMRNEVAKDGVRITTVCPGVIRTGSHVQAKFKGRQAAEYGAFKLAAASPLAVDVTVASKLIVDAMRYGDPFLAFPAPIGWASLLYRTFPNFAGLVLGLITRFMPGPTDESGDTSLSGLQLEEGAVNIPLTGNADKAVSENNEDKA